MAKSQNPQGSDDDFDDEFDDELDDEFGAELDDELRNAFEKTRGDAGADDLDDLDDDFDVDEDDEPLLDAEEALLGEQFDSDGYRIVSLAELAALDDLADEVEIPAPTLTLEEVLYSLVRDVEEVPATELGVLSDLTHAGQALVRQVWPQVPVARRRAVLATLLELAEQWLGVALGPFLRIALNDPDPVVRRLAVEGLWEEEGADLLGHFVYLLEHDDDVEVRAAAARALGPYVLEGELDELDAALAMRAEQALMAVLTSDREPTLVQCMALESIAYSGELGVRQLIEEAYYSPDDDKRLSSLVAMGRSADVRWRRLVHAELTNPDPEMRAQAAYACGELEVKAALPDILGLLLDQNPEVRLAAIFALGHIGGREARNALAAIADGGDEFEAIAASEAIEEMDYYASADAAAMPILDESADHEGLDGAPYHNDDEDDDDLGEYA